MLKSLKYALYVTVHPFDGFWDVKHEKKGNMKTALIVLTLILIVIACSQQFSGYSYNYIPIEERNVFKEWFGFLFPFSLWIISSNCVTSIMDGEGSLRDIFIYSTYAMLPFVFCHVIIIMLSNILPSEAATFLTIINSASYIWCGGLLFFGTLVTHNYSLGKSILVSLIIILAMMVIVMLILICLQLVQQVITFVEIIYDELFVR